MNKYREVKTKNLNERMVMVDELGHDHMMCFSPESIIIKSR